MNYYHYTIWEFAESIIKDGYIKTEKSRMELIEEYRNTGGIREACMLEKAADWTSVLWFSTNETWEETVSKNGKLGLPNQAELKPVRFMVNPKAINLRRWTEYRTLYPEDARRLLKARGGANCYEWFWTDSPVPISEQTITAFDIYMNGQWARVENHFQFFRMYQDDK